MAILEEAFVRGIARSEETRMQKSASAILTEASKATNLSRDIFLSHSVHDAQLVAGFKILLERLKLSVFVDWIDAPQLDRRSVTPATAEELRRQMKLCRGLLYIHTPAATQSKWMPWELGYFDGFKKHVAVVPILERSINAFAGTEYLGIYPYVHYAPQSGTVTQYLWVRDSVGKSQRLDHWLSA